LETRTNCWFGKTTRQTMFDIYAMKNEANNYKAFPRILSLAILVALTILAGGLVRQSAAQEPSPRIKVETSPQVKVEISPQVKVDLSPQVKVDLSSLDKLDEQLSLLDKMDFSSLDKLDLKFLDKMDLKVH